MACDRSHHRWIPAAAIVAAVLVTSVPADAFAGTTRQRATTVAESADRNMMRIIRNQELVDGLRSSPAVVHKPAPLTADELARASRSLVRKALTDARYVRPVPGPITQWYGAHPGIDIAPPYGTPIGAAHSGVVTFVGWDDGYGMHVEVTQLDGYVTTYSHMSAWTVTAGQLVIAGQQLGNVGSTGYSTGPHLHFEVHMPGGSRMDPAGWLRERGVAV